MKTRYLRGLMLCISIILYGQSTHFPVLDGMEKRVQFWTDVFTKYSLNHILIHDSDYPERVYRVLDFRELDARGLLYKNKRLDSIRQAKKEIRDILKKLEFVKDTTALSVEERRIRRLFGTNPVPGTFIRAARHLHTQKGAQETFKAGLVRSGRYVPAMKAIFKEEGLPGELVYLAHVESGFHPKAKSPAGAVGVWQFMKSTGQYYMKIGSSIDERNDPILSTKGAALLLKSNYQKTRSWPLAITAYNHGENGIDRAVKKTKSRDLMKIIRKYRSSLFGYASKNFYAEFLAARRIARNPDRYFPDIVPESPMQFKIVALPFPFTFREVADMFQVPPDLLAEMNPALKQAVTKQGKKIPRGYSFRLPVEIEAVGARVLGAGMGAAIYGL